LYWLFGIKSITSFAVNCLKTVKNKAALSVCPVSKSYPFRNLLFQTFQLGRKDFHILRNLFFGYLGVNLGKIKYNK
jgi:hypothetical protein